MWLLCCFALFGDMLISTGWEWLPRIVADQPSGCRETKSSPEFCLERVAKLFKLDRMYRPAALWEVSCVPSECLETEKQLRKTDRKGCDGILSWGEASQLKFVLPLLSSFVETV